MTHLYISVDLGGTSLRMGILNANGDVLDLICSSSRPLQNPEELISQLSTDLIELTQQSGRKIRGIALGIPGLVNSQEGIVYESPHFPEWKEIHLVRELTKSISIPITMDNDANHAALGEGWRGAAKDWPDFIMLTLGTGIGGGIVIDNKIYHGPTGFAGELGHIVIDRHGIPGALGSAGTLESLASLSGLRTQIGYLQEKRGKNLDPSLAGLKTDAQDLPEKLAVLARQGETHAKAIWQDLGASLGCGLASLVHSFGITHFVIGGGMMGAWDLFHDSCLNETLQRVYPSLRSKIQIVPASLGNQAGLVGGVAALQKIHQ